MEARLFEEGTIPEYSTPAWYAERERAPHVDEAMHRPRLELAAEFVKQAARQVDPGRSWFWTVSDLGAGDGGLLQLLAESGLDLECWGYDLQQSNVDGAAERHVDVSLADVFADEVTLGQIVVCTEMLEHLVDPHRFVRWLFVQGTPQALVASSPWTETVESHYGFHLWAWDPDGYVRMIEGGGWKVQSLKTTGMFQVVLAVRP